jgi:nucleotide-binding universal stress UspA family protein
MFRRILAGFDGSASALQAIRMAREMAVQASGEVSVLIVIPTAHGETEQDRIASFDADAGPLQSRAQLELAEMESKGITTSVHVVSGEHPGKMLSAYVSAHGYDLLVVGRHGRGRAMHGGLGRVALELADSAPCPVLLIGNGGIDVE